MTERQAADLDAVEMMRSIRDELSRKLKDMSHEEQRKYIEEELTTQETHQDKEPRRRSTV